MAPTSRKDQLPPPEFYRDVVVALRYLFPGAELDRTQIQEFDAYLIERWRQRKGMFETLLGICSCDGKRIFLSEGAKAESLPKGRRVALPPESAQPGQVLGEEDLREVGAIIRLRVAIAVHRAKAEMNAQQARVAESMRRSARTERAREHAEENLERHTQAQTEHLKQAAQLESQLNLILSGKEPQRKPRAKAAPKEPTSSPPVKRGRPRKVDMKPPSEASRTKKNGTTEPAQAALPPATPPTSKQTEGLGKGPDARERLLNQRAADFSSDEGL